MESLEGAVRLHIESLQEFKLWGESSIKSMEFTVHKVR